MAIKYQSVLLIAVPSIVFLGFIFAMFLSINSTDQSVRLRGAPTETFHDQLTARSASRQKEDIITTKPFSHLIIVPGHAALHIDKLGKADYEDEAWYLLSYQKNKGFPNIISSHILKSLEVAESDSNSVIIFSGGETRHDVGPLSEAASYYFLAEYKGWISKQMSNRIFLEEYARDSFENLLFSICRFHEVMDAYPQRITIVGFDFKQHRYATLHRKAIHYPESNFSYIGLHAPDPFDQAQAESGEQEAFREFEKDLYGCNDHVLHEKRLKRNPFHRSIPYELSCPDLKALIEFCGPDLIDSHLVPWA